MAVRIEGLPDPHSVTAWNVVEDASSMDPNNMQTGYGQINFSAPDWPLSRMLSGTDVVLEDSDYGTIAGVVRNVSGGVLMSAAADSELGKLNVQRTAGPYIGQLSGLFQRFLDYAGVYSVLEFQAVDRPVAVPGFIGNIWDHVKMACAAFSVELALVGDKVVIREFRTRVIELPNIASYSFGLSRQDSALAVDIAYYNNRQISQGVVFPVPDEEPQIHSVDAGETVEHELSINASLSRVYQPVMHISVGPGDFSGTDGVYTVVGNDNLPIQPAQWAASGGKLEVFLMDEPGKLLLRITGARIDHLSPFRIAESAGGTDYNSLHITGDGVAWDQRNVRLFTGADPLNVSSELGASVDNPYISTINQAFKAGAHTAKAYSGSQMLVNISINKVRGLEQTFGQLIGARVRVDDAYYRIDSVNISPEGVELSGSMDTTMADFDAVWGERTSAEFNALWAGYTAGQFSMLPLRTTDDLS